MKVIILLGLIGAIYGQFGGLVGGWHRCSEKLPEAVVTFATTTLQAKNMDTSNIQINDHSTMCQVVAGMNYKFTVVFGSGNMANEAHFNVYMDLQRHVTLNAPVTYTHPAKRQVGLPGGVGHVDLNDEGLKGAINDASKTVNTMSNAMNHMTVVHVSHATRQVIRGLKYTFDIDFQVSATCRNTEEHYYATLTECPTANDARTTSFHCTVIDVAWETPRYTTTCTMK